MEHAASPPRASYDDVLRAAAVRARREHPNDPLPLHLARRAPDGYLKDAPSDPLAIRAASGETPADRIARWREVVADLRMAGLDPPTLAELAASVTTAAQRTVEEASGHTALNDYRRDNALRYERARVRARRYPRASSPPPTCACGGPLTIPTQRRHSPTRPRRAFSAAARALDTRRSAG